MNPAPDPDTSADRLPLNTSGSSRSSAKPGLMRNLGQFFGHVANGVKSDVPTKTAGQNSPVSHSPAKAGDDSQPPANVVRHEVIERVQQTPGGPVKIRRTIIEEERLADDAAPPQRPSF